MTESNPSRIFVLLDRVESNYHLEIISGIKRAAARLGARVVLLAGGRLGSEESPEPRNFIFERLQITPQDGVVALTGCLSNFSGMDRVVRFLERFEQHQLITLGTAVPSCPSVLVDNAQGVRLLVHHLIEKHGARRIGLLRGPLESVESTSRVQGYRDALAEQGIIEDPRWVVTGGMERDDGVRGVEELFDQRGFRPGTLDAIVCVNDDVALGAIDELHRRGIGVPSPIAVVGFDDSPAAQMSNPPLSTVQQRARDQGEIATESLLYALAQGRRPKDEVISAQITCRDSCGCRARIQNDSRVLDSDRPRVARSCRLALIERRTNIRMQLARAAAGRMLGSHDWEGRMIDALAAQIDSEEGGAFHWEFERLARLHSIHGGDPFVCHDVLTALRLQAILCAEVEPSVRPRLEDLFQEARVVLARVATAVGKEHLDTINLRMRAILQTCLEQVGVPDLKKLSEVLEEQLPLLGVEAFCISHAQSGGEGPLSLLTCRSKGLRIGGGLTELDPLGLDAPLQQLQMVVVEPLVYAGRAVGVASFSWGAVDAFVYEELRDILSLALYAHQNLSSA